MIVFTFAKRSSFSGKIFTKLCAATFLSLQRGARDRFRNSEQIFQIERRMPAWIEIPITDDTDPAGAFPKHFQMIEGRSHFAFVPHDADIVLHDFLQIALHGVRILAGAVLEWF